MQKLLIALLAGIGIWLLVLFLLQDKLILFPGQAPPGFAGNVGSRDWAAFGEHRGVVFEPAEAATGTVGTVMVFHGNAGIAEDRAGMARPFLARGLRVVLQEYPGYGRRPGKASMRTALAAGHDDFAAAHKTWGGRFYLVGESFGAGVAAQVAGANPDKVAGVLLITPWNSLKALVNEKFGGIPVGFLLKEKLDSAAALKSFRRPVIIVAAGADELIPPRHAQALARSLPGAAYQELTGTGHNDWLYRMTPQDWDRCLHPLLAAPK
jgi:pimeloyl-ACP methyl ester carboxylesterase